MSMEEIKDGAAMIATEVSMVGDDVMQADFSVGKAEFVLDLVLDAIADGASGLRGVLKHCKEAAAPLGFAHESLQEKQRTLQQLGLHESTQAVTRDVPERLGVLVTRAGSYAYAAAELSRSAGELSKELDATLEKANALRQAFQETRNNTGSDVVEALRAYADATEAFVQYDG